jgi:hypothetical protein
MMPTTPKGSLVTPIPKRGNIRTLEKGGGGSPFSRTPLLGATRNAGGTITELGDMNEGLSDLANLMEWTNQKYVLHWQNDAVGLANQFWMPVHIANNRTLKAFRVAAFAFATSGSLTALGLRWRTLGGYIGAQFDLTIAANEGRYSDLTDTLTLFNNSGAADVFPLGLEVTALTQTGASRLMVYADLGINAP